MSELIESLWRRFGIEAGERFDDIERLLMARGPERASEAAALETVAALFRAFHSLKGAARAMDLFGMEKLAHRAETVLGRVRAGELALAGVVGDTLLEALDALRAMSERGAREHADAQPPAPLLGALEALSEGAGEGAGASARAARSPAAPAIRLHDNEKLLGRFVEHLRDGMATLAPAIDLDSLDEEGRRAAEETAERLEIACERLSLLPFADILKGFRAHLGEGDADRVLADLRAVAVAAARVGRLAGGDAGAQTLIRQLDARHPPSAAPKEAVSGPGEIDAGPPPAKPELTAGEWAALGLGAAPSRALSPESAWALRQALDSGVGLFEVTAYLEDDAELASGFAAWLEGKVQAITNWPEFIDGQTWLKVLVASPQAPEALARQLASLDASGRRLSARLRRPRQAGEGDAPPALAPAPAPAQTPAPAGGSGGGMLRVPGEVIDAFMGRIDAMALLSGALNALAADTRVEEAMAALTERLGPGDQDARRAREAMERHRRALGDLDTRLSAGIDRLRESALDLRVAPVEALFNPLPRLVRELARAQGKKIRVIVDGGDARIDKSMVEVLSDPLMHMVRNAVDHGIEPPDERQRRGKPEWASLSLRAIQRSSRVVVEIADDGRGIATEAVRAKAVHLGLIGEEESRRLSPAEIHDFIFQPGFSTQEVVSETSGRGVGMDVVRTAIQGLGGTIAPRTQPGQGTVIVIELPLSAAIVRTVLVEVDGQVLAIPDRFVEEVCGLDAADFHEADGGQDARRRDRALPVVHLARVLGFPPPFSNRRGGGERQVVVLKRGDQRVGVEIDRLLRRGDLFVRESHPGLAEVPGVGGVSLLNDGRIVVILEGEELFRLALAARGVGSGR